MTSRIRDLTRTYDWYIYHGQINGKRTIQIESTTSRNGYNQGCGAVTFLVGSGSGSGSGKEFRLQLRLRLRVKLFGGSGSGSGSDDQVLI